MAKRAFHIGVISDTHGLLREEALQALQGSDLIVHAGDMGSPLIVPHLRRIAPVVAVRGNVDREPWAAPYRQREVVTQESLLIYVLHNLRELDLAPAKAGFAAVISGHTHDPKFYVKDGVLYFNPGSAGPRRFRLPVSLGKITVVGGELLPELITLNISD
jgi:putative phosphoesterase